MFKRPYPLTKLGVRSFCQNCAAASFEESQSDTIVFARHGQVAQSVERSPEKAGVGGSIPSLATTFNNLQATISHLGCKWLHFDVNCNHVFIAQTFQLGHRPSAGGLHSAAIPALAAGRHPASRTRSAVPHDSLGILDIDSGLLQPSRTGPP
jgi:hypothetical protein